MFTYMRYKYKSFPYDHTIFILISWYAKYIVLESTWVLALQISLFHVASSEILQMPTMHWKPIWNRCSHIQSSACEKNSTAIIKVYSEGHARFIYYNNDGGHAKGNFHSVDVEWFVIRISISEDFPIQTYNFRCAKMSACRLHAYSCVHSCTRDSNCVKRQY